jgi:uncharacterized phage protein (TIGR01671 family)
MTPEFRVWDTENNLYSTNQVFYYMSPEGEVYDSSFGEIDSNVTNTVIVEQYTGLKDKDGNKIFEGDILKLSYDDPKTYLYTDEYDCNPKIIPPKTVTRTVKVINEKGAFRVIALHIKLYVTRLLCDVDQGRENIEIIGNVHENPELLEVNK